MAITAREATGPTEECDELSLVEGAVDDDHVIASARIPQDLEADPELIRPEIRNGGERRGRLRAGQHAAGRRDPRFGRHLPVFDANELVAAVVTPMPSCDIARGDHAVGGEEAVVADHAIFEGEP